MQRRELANAGAKLFIGKAGVPIVDGERQVHAAGMVNADEGGVRDDVHGLRAAIVGMGTPTDIRKQTGGGAEPLLVGLLLDAKRGKRLPRPRDQLLAMRRRAGAQERQLARRRK